MAGPSLNERILTDREQLVLESWRDYVEELYRFHNGNIPNLKKA